MPNLLKKPDLKNFIRRAAFITLTLAVIEVLIFLPFYEKRGHSTTHKTNIEKSATIYPFKDNIDSNTGNIKSHEQTVVDTTKNEALKDSLITEKKLPIPKDSISPIYSIKEKSSFSAKKKLTSKNKRVILQKIRAYTRRLKMTNNCVQVRKSVTSNVADAFSIAELLKANGYIIEGRIITYENTKGIDVKLTAGCIQVTIGTL